MKSKKPNRNLFQMAGKTGYYANVRVSLADGPGIRRRKMGETPREARATLLSYLEAEEAGDSEPHCSRPLRWLVDRYLEAIHPRRETGDEEDQETHKPRPEEWRANRVALKSWKAYRRSCRGLCAFVDDESGRPLGLKDPREIKPYHVTRWILENSERWGQSSERAVVQHLKILFGWAVRMELIDRNPLVNMSPAASVVRKTLVSDEDYAKLLKQAPDALCRMMRFLRGTMCRPDEARRLTAADLSEDCTSASLTKHKTSKKTGTARHLFFASGLVPLVKQLALEHPEGPLLRDPAGDAWTAPGLSTAFAEVRKHLGLPKGLVLYCLRHTAITEALANGVGIEQVSKLAGHSNIKITSAVYAHVLDPQFRSTMMSAIEKAAGAK